MWTLEQPTNNQSKKMAAPLCLHLGSLPRALFPSNQPTIIEENGSALVPPSYLDFIPILFSFYCHLIWVQPPFYLVFIPILFRFHSYVIRISVPSYPGSISILLKFHPISFKFHSYLIQVKISSYLDFSPISFRFHSQHWISFPYYGILYPFSFGIYSHFTRASLSFDR